jgi:tetratricopeptide (TPR) repeat protein
MRAMVIAAGVAALSAVGCARGAPSETPQPPMVHEHDAAHDAHGHGVVDFPTSCNEEAQAHIEMGLAHLHHMMYDQSSPLFEAAVEADADCAMAQWGIAMTSFHPLWSPTSAAGLERGQAAIEAAYAIGAPTEREQGYILAADAFFADPEPPQADEPSDHKARVKSWMEAQGELHEAFPEDVDAAAFYGLAQIAYAQAQFSPAREPDYTLNRQAGAMLERYLEKHPQHPGLFHYIIHAYDSAELAPLAAAVARGYDELAPDVPHALHMPSHIFVRMGKWEETVSWNIRSAESAKRQPVNGQTSLHYPHALDYMMYGYLQLGDEAKARETLEAVRAIDDAQPVFAAAYGIAAPQARYYLEQGKWEEAAQLAPRQPAALPWENFPAAEALFAYARGLGAARSGDLDLAKAERQKLEGYVAALRDGGDAYWAAMTEALSKAVAGWILHAEGRTQRALALLSEAADLEDSMDKHPITPGEVLPVRELYGEMLTLEGRVEEAAKAFEASLRRTPNRRNAVAGLEQLGHEVASSDE